MKDLKPGDLVKDAKKGFPFATILNKRIQKTRWGEEYTMWKILSPDGESFEEYEDFIEKIDS